MFRKISRSLIGTVCLILPLTSTQARVEKIPRRVTIELSTLQDKLKGAWAAQTIGCTYGGPTEFRYHGQTIPDSVAIEWPEHHARNFFDKWPELYDDVYMDLTFLHTLHRLGLDAPVDSMALAFAHAGYSLWHANQAARYNILRGIMPPKSGHWLNNPHADDIDYQIEADFAGIISPGMPNATSRISDRVGHIMNYGDGWYGGVFIGAMYSLAYVNNDIPTIVEQALKTIPRKSRFYQTIADVIRWHREYPHDWKRTWQCCQDKWSNEVGCPEGILKPLNIDASLNSAYVVIGLLYGEGDFGRTMEIATRCGQDSDCNPASAAGILGCILGYSNIPEKWMPNLKEVEDRPFKYTDISLQKAYKLSFELALKLIEREGGSVGNNKVTIRLQSPKSVRYEQSFPHLLPSYCIKGSKLTEKTTEIEFDGCGIVVRNKVKAQQQNYVAQVEVYIDGKLYSTASSAANYHDRTPELFWIYDLKPGHHTLRLKWCNPQTDAEVNCHEYVVYKKKQK